MRIAIQYGPFCLSFRGSLDVPGYRQDPRGLSGSELAAIRISEEMGKLGHEVDLHTVTQEFSYHDALRVVPWGKRDISKHYDAVLNINTPDDLRGVNAKLKLTYHLLNDFTYCRSGFDQHVDLYVSPSEPHRQMILNRVHDVEVGAAGPASRYSAEDKAWKTIPLGCDPWNYGDVGKIRGRVVYCSSPDRGLHLLLEQWPRIRRAVPWATLRVFYRLRPWIEQLRSNDYFRPIEPLRARALYVDECLRRLEGHGVEVMDAVSREQIELEMSQAEVLGFPCDPTNHFTEGFSCTVLEGCAAEACPVISDADALGELYRDACIVVPRGDWTAWGDRVIEALKSQALRDETNAKALAFAKRHTWAATAKAFETLIKERV